MFLGFSHFRRIFRDNDHSHGIVFVK